MVQDLVQKKKKGGRDKRKGQHKKKRKKKKEKGKNIKRLRYKASQQRAF